jgi:hypothetical protein
MTMENRSPRPGSTLFAAAYLCFGIGTVLMLAMSFGQLPAGRALFLGTSAYVIGGLIWGYGARTQRAVGAGDGLGPTVDRR